MWYEETLFNICKGVVQTLRNAKFLNFDHPPPPYVTLFDYFVIQKGWGCHTLLPPYPPLKRYVTFERPQMSHMWKQGTTIVMHILGLFHMIAISIGVVSVGQGGALASPLFTYAIYSREPPLISSPPLIWL